MSALVEMHELLRRVEAQANDVSEEADVDDVDRPVSRPGRPPSSCWDFFNDDANAKKTDVGACKICKQKIRHHKKVTGSEGI